jgi:NAD+ kinase
MSINKIGLLYHPLNERALKQARRLQQVIEAEGVSAWTCSAWEPEHICGELDNTDLIITAGGDGTILRAAQAVVTLDIPITGVNLGKLGFMTELTTAEAEKKIGLLLRGDGWLDERMVVEAELEQETQEGPEKHHYYALNDVVIARGGIARIIGIDASVDGDRLASYKADGVIVSTATGSTGYALAAGGPILHPQVRSYLLVPIAPHVSFHHSLLIPHDSTVTLKLAAHHPATMSIDGHISVALCDGASITIKSSPRRVRFLRLRPKGDFFTTLESKLKG